MPSSHESRKSPSDLVERLFIQWVISTLLLAVFGVTAAVIVGGQVRRLSSTISAQTEAIDALSTRLAQAEADLAALRQTQRRPDPPPATRPVSRPAAASATTDADAATRIDAHLAWDDGVARLVDPPAARVELARLGGSPERKDWSASTLEKLAILALLLDDEFGAEALAAQAEARGGAPLMFAELRVQQLLARGDAARAAGVADRAARLAPSLPAARLLVAQTRVAAGERAAADLALATPFDASSLSGVQRVRLGEVWVALESWTRLEDLLPTLTSTAGFLGDRVNLLRAVSAIHRGNAVEALAILDHLLESRPEDYDLRTWRGVALLRARQFAAARAALGHAEASATRPEAWYWLGRVEMDAGQPAAAIDHLNRALRASPRFAPALEALGSIALGQADDAAGAGDVDVAERELAVAVAHLVAAIDADPRRATARFKLAVAHAKASRVEQTASALEAAFALDPSLLDAARKTEVITRLLSDEDLLELATPVAASTPASQSVTP